MLEELDYDLARQQIHISPYLSGQGVHDFTELLREAITNGSEVTLKQALDQKRRITRAAPRKMADGFQIVSVPSNAAEMIADDAFNRYYIRALGRRALADGIEHLVVYRARSVQTPRPQSEALVETAVDPAALLEDLRQHTGEETALGIPGGPNSGISVHLP